MTKSMTESRRNFLKLGAGALTGLLSYIYSAAVLAHENGIPIMRSMAVSFPSERNLSAVGNQYLFGEDILVAPVLNEQNSRTILFPSGQWTSLWNGRTVSGPAHLPVYRCEFLSASF